MTVTSHALETLAEAAASCRNCDLWRDATRTVFGTEDTGQFLHEVVLTLGDTDDWTPAEWDDAARAAITATRAEGGKIPGLGHPAAPA